MTCIGKLIAASLLLPLQPALAEFPDRVPSVGLDGPQSDGCASVGRVTGLNPGRDYFLSVHARPDEASKKKDRLGPATLVWLCEAEGAWQGIVYAPAGRDFGECRVSSPVAKPEPYSGPCLFGWVDGHYIQLNSG
jgi:hypothetical protein